MKCYFLIFCLMIVTIAVSSATAGGEKLGSVCKNSRECESRYCRDQKCINFGDDPNDKGANPCKPNPCRLGEPCTLDQVTCVRYPCRPVPSCKYDL